MGKDGALRNSIGCLLSIALAWAGCATEFQPAPLLSEVCQARDAAVCISWAYAGEQVDLALLGEDLLQVFEVDLGDDGHPEIPGEFSASIGGVPLDDVRLSPDRLRGQEMLLASLPGELPAGEHEVKVTTPSGQQVLRPRLFFIRDPVWVELEIEKPTLPRGDENRLTVRIENRSSAALAEVTLDLAQGGSGSYVLPAPPPPFSLPGDSFADVVLDLVAGSPGLPQVAVDVDAMAGADIRVGTSHPAIISSAVLEAADLVVEARIEPRVVSVGEPIELFVTALNEGGVAVLDAGLLPPRVEGAGTIQWEQVPGRLHDIEPGGNMAFRRSGIAIEPGTAWILPTVTGNEALSGRPLEASAPYSIPVKIQ